MSVDHSTAVDLDGFCLDITFYNCCRINDNRTIYLNITFDCTGDTVVFCAVETEEFSYTGIIIGVAAAAAAAGAWLTLKSRRKKLAPEGPETEPETPGSGDET